MPEFLADGRYQVIETLLADDLQVVQRCRDTKVGRDVLIQGPGPALQAHTAGAEPERNMREARALARVDHPGVQRLLDVIESDGGPLLVLEPVAGETLAARLEREGPLPVADVAKLGHDLADVLAAVHEAGIVHRALSPENVMLPACGGVRLRGFSHAKPNAGSTGLTSLPYQSAGGKGMRALLPRYPAPEQIRGEAAGPRTDLFGLGCLLYRAATGEDAFDDLLAFGAQQTPRRFGRAVARAPSGLAKIVDACLARNPQERPRSAADMRDALAASLPAPGGGRKPSSASAGRRGALVAVAVVVVAAVGYWAWSRPGPGGEEAARGFPIEKERGFTLENKSKSSTEGYEPGFDKSYALVIGIGDVYDGEEWKKLPNAASDARAVAARLKELPKPWEVTQLLEKEATRQEILGALDGLATKAKREDRVFVYFAGHGSKHLKSLGYLVPADAEEGNRLSNVNFREFDGYLDQMEAKHVLVALDCCYSGRLLQRPTMRSATPVYEQRYLRKKARVVLCAGQDEPVSDGEAGGHSPFAQAFLDALATPATLDVEAITSTHIFATIQTGLRKAEQTPMHMGEGEFVFFLKKTP